MQHDGTASPSGTTSYYFIFDNLTVMGSSWASAVRLEGTQNLNISIENRGTTTIKGYNHPAFILGDTFTNVDISVTSDGGFDTFICGRQYSLSDPTLYQAGKVNSFTMNGVAVDEYGNTIS